MADENSNPGAGGGATILSSGGAVAAAETPGVVQNQTLQPEAAAVSVPATQTQAVTFDKVLAADGGLADNWRDVLPEDIRNEPCLQNIKHFSAMAKSFVHSQKAIGANKIAVPGEHATEAEKAAFYQALGRPEAAEKYEINPPKELPDGLTFDPALVEGFKKTAFELGLNQKQAQALVEYQANLAAAQITAQEAAMHAAYDSTIAKLTSEYGDRLPSVVAQAEKAIDTFGVRGVLKQHNLLNRYEIIKAMAGIGERISEAKLKGNPGDSVAGDAQGRLNAITGNLNDPYYLREHPQHEQRVREVNELVGQLRK